MTIGDVLAVVAGLFAICLSAWSLIMMCGLLMPKKAEAAREALYLSAHKCIGIGFAIGIVPGFIGFGLAVNAPLPGKIFGWLLLLGILSLAAIGASGVSFVAGDRLQDLAPDMSPYSVFAKGSAFLVIASILPIVGWFLFGPLAFLASVGSGFRAVAPAVRTSRPHNADAAA